MGEETGLYLQHQLYDLFMGAGWGASYSERDDRWRGEDMKLGSICRRRMEAPLKIQVSCRYGDPDKFARFLECAEKDRRRHRHRKNRDTKAPSAWLFVEFDDVGARGTVLTRAAFDALYARFRNADPRPGWIYVLLVASDGSSEWKPNPYAYAEEIAARRERAFSNVADRVSGRVTGLNGSGFYIQIGPGKRNKRFAYYTSIGNGDKSRPALFANITCLPTGRTNRRLKLVDAVLIEGRR